MAVNKPLVAAALLFAASAVGFKAGTRPSKEAVDIILRNSQKQDLSDVLSNISGQRKIAGALKREITGMGLKVARLATVRKEAGFLPATQVSLSDIEKAIKELNSPHITVPELIAAHALHGRITALADLEPPGERRDKLIELQQSLREAIGHRHAQNRSFMPLIQYMLPVEPNPLDVLRQRIREHQAIIDHSIALQRIQRRLKQNRNLSSRLLVQRIRAHQDRIAEASRYPSGTSTRRYFYGKANRAGYREPYYRDYMPESQADDESRRRRIISDSQEAIINLRNELLRTRQEDLENARSSEDSLKDKLIENSRREIERLNREISRREPRESTRISRINERNLRNIRREVVRRRPYSRR